MSPGEPLLEVRELISVREDWSNSTNQFDLLEGREPLEPFDPEEHCRNRAEMCDLSP